MPILTIDPEVLGTGDGYVFLDIAIVNAQGTAADSSGKTLLPLKAKRIDDLTTYTLPSTASLTPAGTRYRFIIKDHRGPLGDSGGVEFTANANLGDLLAAANYDVPYTPGLVAQAAQHAADAEAAAINAQAIVSSFTGSLSEVPGFHLARVAYKVSGSYPSPSAVESHEQIIWVGTTAPTSPRTGDLYLPVDTDPVVAP